METPLSPRTSSTTLPGVQRGDVVAGRFEIETTARSGGMGSVHRARDRRTGEMVAVKLLRGRSKDHLDRFERESVVLAGLDHPGIVHYVAHGRAEDGTRWLAMEWLEGEDLAQRLARQGLTIPESIELLRRISEALGVAHGLGIIHRDVKPGNLLLVDKDIARVKVLDFGVARLDAGAAAVTSAGLVIGTPGYMAPEQARGDPSIDARADVFGLGCIAFECLTGRQAFEGEHVMALLAKILLEETPRVRELRPEIPAALDELVAQMLSKDRENRPADGSTIARALASLPSVGPVSRAPISVRPPALTGSELRLVSVVIAAGKRVTVDDQLARTLTPEDLGSTIVPLQHALAPLGARVDVLVDSTIVVSIAGTGGATEQAANAARCALTLRAFRPEMPMVLATGRGVLAERLPVGDVIERAVKLVRDAPVHRGVRLDDVTAGLLDVRFDVRGDGQGLVLHAEREIMEGTRTLLGRPTSCVGREREISAITALFDDCVAESHAAATLVTAPAGVGKSRLRHELLKTIRNKGAVEVFIGRGDPVSMGSPYGILAPAIRRSAGILDGEPIEIRRRRLHARIARHVRFVYGSELQRIVEFIGELVSVPFPDDQSQWLRAARRDATLMNDQVRRAFEEFLQAECGAQPVVIVLEDLHWGDQPTVKLVEGALRNLQDAPLFVLALARPEVHDVFPKLWSGRPVTEIGLSALTRKAAEKLVRASLPALDDEAVARLVERAAGNAFYLEELIRAVAEGKGDALPETVLAMVQSRLEQLDPEARRVLRAASTFGQVFWRGGIRALLGGADRTVDLDDWLSRLVDREVIARLPNARFPGEVEYGFRHALVREGAYGMLTDDDRVLAHRLAGTWLETVGENDAMVIADHFDRGSDAAHAVHWYLRAAEQAREGDDFESVIARARRAVALGAEGPTLGTLMQLEAEAHRWRGSMVDARREYGEHALTLLPHGSARWCLAAVEVAPAARGQGDLARLEGLAHELCALESDVDARMAHIQALSAVSRHLQFAGMYSLAQSVVDRMAEVAATVEGNADLVAAWTYRARAQLKTYAGDPEYLQLLDLARERFEAAGDRRFAASLRGEAGEAYRELGMFREAEAAYRDCITMSDRMGLLSVSAVIRSNMGLMLAYLGRADEAILMERLALETFTESADPRYRGITRAYLALGLDLAERFDEAREEARVAAETLVSVQPMLPFALALRARIELHARRFDEAARLAKEAYELMCTIGQVEEGEAFVRLVHAEALHAVGDRSGSRTAIAEARDKLLARAADIPEPALRASFLGNVPDHARTIALAHEWS